MIDWGNERWTNNSDLIGHCLQGPIYKGKLIISDDDDAELFDWQKACSLFPARATVRDPQHHNLWHHAMSKISIPWALISIS